MSAPKIEAKFQQLLPSPHKEKLDPSFDITGKKMGEPPEYRRLKYVFQYLPAALKEALLEELFRTYMPKSPAEYAQERFVSAAGVRGFNEAGMEVAAHTVTHPPFDAISLAEIEDELRESKERLHDEIGREVTSFAWPFGGTFSLEAQELVAKHYKSGWNYNGALTSLPENPFGNMYDIPRLFEQRFLPSTS